MPIKIENLDFEYLANSRFAFQALRDINLKIPENKIIALIGKTGSGKSTLVQHLNGLLRPTKGCVFVDDFMIVPNQKVKKIKQLRQKVGLIFQFPEAQLFEETVLKDVMFGPLNFDKTRDNALELAQKALLDVGISPDLWSKSPLELSGGQKRKVAIAGILALDPDVIVADEPTAGLDPKSSRDMMDLFVKKNKQESKTLIMVTHDLNAVFEYADHVIVLDGGELVYSDSVNDFFKNYQLINDLGFVLPPIINLQQELLLSDNLYHFDDCVDMLIKELK